MNVLIEFVNKLLYENFNITFIIKYKKTIKESITYFFVKLKKKTF